jgi:hypothetical protein
MTEHTRHSSQDEASAPPPDPSLCRHSAITSNDGSALPNDNHPLINDGCPQVSTDPVWPINLVQIIRNLTSTMTSKLDATECNFSLTREAAENNAKVLEKYDSDLERAIQAQRGSPVGYGSEFRPKDQLVQLFSLHPCWPRMKSILTRWSFWPRPG